MNYDEFAFFNQQLAGMLKSGIPLEGALRQLCETMRAGELRSELEALGADLARGVPLREALPRRTLPKFYVEMIQVGTHSNDLPGVLTMVADHYQRAASLWGRLKALMVYPALVYLVMLAVFLFLGWLVLNLSRTWTETWLTTLGSSRINLTPWLAMLPAAWLILFGVAFMAAMLAPGGRAWLRRKLPGFREANLARFASSMKLLLHGGSPLPQAVELMQTMEEGSDMGGELADWQARLAAGHRKLSEVATAGRAFPPLFVWLVSQGGEDLASGFGRAAEIYFQRARYRIEMMLFAALPVAILVLGTMLAFCLQPALRSIMLFVNMLTAMD